MADTLAPLHTQPRAITGRTLRLDAPAQPILPPSVSTLRSGQLTLDTLSPVNQNGSFEFDRVIKSGQVLKRTRKTKAWKPIHIVLRPNLLSIYRNSEEDKLRHQITLSDLTAVARQKDPKGKAQHVFGLFLPSRNFHLGAKSDQEAQEWVELIRREARIDEGEEEMSLASPGGARGFYSGFERHLSRGAQPNAMVDRTAGYSSSEAEPFPRSTPIRTTNASALHSARRASHTMDYSGPEHGSYSDFSDSMMGPTARMSALSLPSPEQQTNLATSPSSNTVYGPSLISNAIQSAASQASFSGAHEQRPAPAHDSERVICHGWLYLLKTTSGMRQWKKLWVVLRLKSLALYKNEEEYSAVWVLSFSSIIDAVEIDPVSHSKRFCLQIITEEKNYRLCAPDEDSLARWLGAFKSLLVKRKESQNQR